MNVIGHTTIVSLMEKNIEQGMLGHAYCFIGIDHVGKEAVACHIAALVLDIPIEKLINSADMLTLRRLKDEKTGKTKKDISIDQIKEINQFMARSALRAGGHKVAIITEADTMSRSAANALLKTLEEPSPQSHIFLLASDEAALLPTIKSRCRVIRFQPVHSQLIFAYLTERGMDSHEADMLARLSRGLPGLAILWYDNKDIFIRHKEEVRRFLDLFGKTFHQKLQEIDDMFGDKSDAIGTRDDIKETLDIWRLVARDIFFYSHGREHHAVHEIQTFQNISRSDVLSIDETIVHARRMIDKNVHPRLLIEQILLRIP